MPRELIVESAEKQIDIIRETVTLPQYLDFCSGHFEGTDSHNWIRAIDAYFSRYNQSTFHPDYFRFLTLVATLWAQYGFVGVGRFISRHDDKGWLLSPLDPRHILGSGIYTAKLNLQSYHYKQVCHASQIQKVARNPDRAWQSVMFVKNGIVRIPSQYTLQGSSLDDLDSKRAICLPNYPLNHAFADIPFTGEMAENMSSRQFRQEIIPQVADVIGELMDPEKIFFNSRV